MNALNAYNRLNANVAGLKKASEKLSSGYRINRAGDDAAGLAISEKMRSQIKGLNQAIRNSQDGINMIQTFEGAAQETHSILQRMKELATESANGTYDNPTDREAIQLEFSQLNDELNQIADTDYNGTIVLNGGEMADGLKVGELKDGIGEFTYTAGKTEAEKTLDVTTYTVDDRHSAESAKNILDNSTYDIDSANALWKTLGLDASKDKEVNITFVKNGDNWEAKAASTGVNKPATPAVPESYAITGTETPAAGKKCATLANATDEQKAALAEDLKAAGYADGEAFTINMTGANAGTIDSDAGAGAQITIDAAALTKYGITIAGTGTFGATSGLSLKVNPAEDEKPAVNTEVVRDDIKYDALKVTNNKNSAGTGEGGFKVSWSDGANTFDVSAIFDASKSKDGDYITLKFTNTDEKSFAPKTIGILEDTLSVDLKGDGSKMVDAAPKDFIKVELDAGITDDKMTDDIKKALEALKDLKLEYNAANAGAEFTAAGNAGGTAVGAGADVVAIKADGTIEYWDSKAGAAATLGKVTVDANKFDDFDNTAGKFECKLKPDSFHFAGDVDVEANSVATSDVLKAAATGGKDTAVTNANAFKNSTARMTYANNITLQTGARTKDAVNFTFKYNQNGTADMGSLQANLNLSSRADGLNTANLSLANQKDANYAIDQIDKAINKTSMVRATFGSIQNRLEHKITNLTTTQENLTEAESSIRDTDMASEMMNYTKFNILQQAAQSMLAQANQQPQSVLQLLG